MTVASIILGTCLFLDAAFVAAWIAKCYIKRSHQRKYWRCYNTFRQISEYDPETLLEELNRDFNNPKILW